MKPKYVLLRTQQPAYSNTDQTQENLAIEIETKKRQSLLQSYLNLHDRNAQLKLIGEQQAPPIGDKLYTDKGLFKLPVFYQQTQYGNPWIIIGTANSLIDFENELATDDELLALKPTGIIAQIEAIFITENDFDLSAIKHYNITDIGDIII